MSPEVRGGYVFALMAVLFHFLQENKPMAILSSWSHLEKINAWIAGKLHTSTQVVLRVEIGGISALGFTLMQIGEWAGAVACWVVLGIILFGKALAWNGVKGHKRITAFLRLLAAVSAVAIAVLLITITDLRKPDGEPWSNIQKLGRGKRQQQITASELRQDTLELVKELRAFQTKADSELYQLMHTQTLETALAETENDKNLLFQSHTQQLVNLSSTFDSEYAPLAIRASIIQAQMYRFLPEQVATPPPMVANAMGGGRFSGPSAAKGVADHLETLARLLPH